MARLTVHRYLEGPESMRPMELIFGYVREPPSPFATHQGVVTRLTSALYEHARRRGLGAVYVSPIDVVLDEARALVVQPDVIFIAAARQHIVRDRVWGAPDLVVEVLSPGTARRDRTQKLRWYRQYGVKECWLVDPLRRRVDVIACDARPRARRQVYAGSTPIRSRVLADLELPVGEILQDRS
jgi:Uma2 family endonuclease